MGGSGAGRAFEARRFQRHLHRLAKAVAFAKDAKKGADRPWRASGGKLDPDRHVIGRLFPCAHLFVDLGILQQIGGLR